jgi:hypothetical protein
LIDEKRLKKYIKKSKDILNGCYSVQKKLSVPTKITKDSIIFRKYFGN